MMYQVMDVPGRSGVRLHSANWVRQLHGCLAPGLAYDLGQMAVWNSATALRRLEEKMDRKPFQLEILPSLDLN